METLEPEDLEQDRPPKPAAIAITIQSWATPIVGVLMLAIGLLGGYMARPLIAPPDSTNAAAPATPAGASSSSASQATLMEAVVAQTRHFKGDPDAPVTIIEFGDFQ